MTGPILARWARPETDPEPILVRFSRIAEASRAQSQSTSTLRIFVDRIRFPRTNISRRTAWDLLGNEPDISFQVQHLREGSWGLLYEPTRVGQDTYEWNLAEQRRTDRMLGLVADRYEVTAESALVFDFQDADTTRSTGDPAGRITVRYSDLMRALRQPEGVADFAADSGVHMWLRLERLE